MLRTKKNLYECIKCHLRVRRWEWAGLGECRGGRACGPRLSQFSSIGVLNTARLHSEL